MSAHLITEKIKASGISIYDLAPLSDKSLWIPDSDLYCLLVKGLCGLSLAGLPLRTRSKVLKSAVCEAIGYSVPRSFKKTQPRFPGQNFDTYTMILNHQKQKLHYNCALCIFLCHCRCLPIHPQDKHHLFRRHQLCFWNQSLL